MVVERLENVGNWETARSAAMVMHQTGVRELTELAKVSVVEYREIANRNDIGYHQVGSILFSTNESKGKEEIQRRILLQTGLGVESIFMDSSEINARVPFIYAGDIVAACYCPLDGYVDPNSVVNFYYSEARNAGVKFLKGREGHPVASAGCVNGVRIDEETIEAEFLVNAAGGMAHLIGKEVGLHLPISANIRYLSVIEPNPHVTNSLILEDIDSEWYIRPESGGTLLIGEGPVTPYEITEDNKNFYPPKENTAVVERLAKHISYRFPRLLDSKPVASWPGIRSITTKGLPLLGGVEDIEGYINCCGMSGFGVTLAPACGRLTAELIADGKTSVSLEPFLLSRSGTGGP